MHVFVGVGVWVVRMYQVVPHVSFSIGLISCYGYLIAGLHLAWGTRDQASRGKEEKRVNWWAT